MARFRPRFSLLTALLLTALVACGITIWLLWREVGPLRAEVRRMRTELGHLNVDDPKKGYAIRLPTGDPRHWKWRIYLPPGRYVQACYSGTLPPPDAFHGEDWTESITNSTSGSSGTIDGGQFTQDAKLEREDDRWILVTSKSGGRGIGRQSVYQPSGDWLSELKNLSESSRVAMQQQSEFDLDEPILLLKVVKAVVTEFPGGYSKRAPNGAADGFVLWIGPMPSRGEAAE